MGLGSLPSVSFKLRRLRSETAGPNGLGFVEVTFCDIGLSEFSCPTALCTTLLPFVFNDPPYIILIFICITTTIIIRVIHSQLYPPAAYSILSNPQSPSPRPTHLWFYILIQIPLFLPSNCQIYTITHIGILVTLLDLLLPLGHSSVIHAAQFL